MPAEALIELTDLPPSNAGAPRPVVYANERAVLVAYELAEHARGELEGDVSGVVIFKRAQSHLFGPPNDETVHGHRLAKYGLGPYSFWEVKHSIWIAELCARNRVHPHHQDLHYADFRHFIFTFHDSTLEVAARAYGATVEPGEPIDCVARKLHDRHTWS
jgi:hypothetical protein